MLRVKLLIETARPPEVHHEGEDLGYDVFALETTILVPGETRAVRTGIAVEALPPETGRPLGLLLRDRSSVALRGIIVSAGVIDAGYRGEIRIVMTNLTESTVTLIVGEKIAQMIPTLILTDEVTVVDHLTESKRGTGGFGSSGISPAL